MTTRFQVRTILLAILSLIPAQAAVNTALLHSTFQRDGASRYLWNGPNALAKLGPGGGVEFQSKQEGIATLKMDFPGANPNSTPTTGPETAVPFRYYDEASREGSLVEQFRSVRYRGLYPGIDAIFRVEGSNLEYDFELAPHADPSLIRIGYANTQPRVNQDGELEAGWVVQKRPVAYQLDHGVRVPVACRYRVTASGQAALELGGYDPARPLTIDPTLTFSTTFGGQGYDNAYAMAVSGGAIYIAGETDSVSFTGWGRRTSRDAFVAKIDSTGTNLLYITFFGGSLTDVARGLAVDSSGNVFAAGYSNSADFPTTAGVIQPSNRGLEDAFVVKLNASGARTWSTLFGTSASDAAYGVAVDSSGNPYITGQTGGAVSTDTAAIQRVFKGGTDCFIAKLSPNGTGYFYSTMYGGSGVDACRGIAVDSSGAAYVAGVTYSSDFPVVSAYQSSRKGIADAFVVKLGPTGWTVSYSTYLGGGGYDEANAIAVDSTGAAYVTGETLSADFPVSAGSAQTTAAGEYDAFIAKLSPTGGSLTYSTLMGGSGSETAASIAVDSTGRAIVGGFTTSLNLPVRQAVQSSLVSGFDAFAVVVDKNGASFTVCTYLGGSGDDRAWAVAAGSGNSFYVAGSSQSPEFPKTGGTTITAGNADVFAAWITYTPPAISGKVFVPVTACRVADTRATSGFASPFGPPYVTGNGYRSFPIPQGSCGVPSTAKAYSLNITALPRGKQLQYITVWPSGQSRPVVSTLNAFDGRVVTNSAIVPAGTSATNGGVSIYVSEDTELLVDVNGYFIDPTAGSGLLFYTANPCRIADTRGYSGVVAPFSTPYMSAGATRTFPIAQSPCAVPAPQVYSLNITVVPRTSTLQSLTMWPTGQTKPPVMTVSSVNGQVVAGAALVQAGTSGSVNVSASEDTEVLFDINGYFAATSDTGLSFTEVTPCRVIDTRQNTSIGPSTASQRSIDVLGSGCSIPSSAKAYSVNITVLPVKTLQYLSAWPTGQTFPTVSTLNSFNGAWVANAAIVPAGTGGKIDVLASDQTEVIIDINGYFAP